MDKFDAMRVFIRVVESGNFTKASETLDIPKPTVTRLILGLEDALSTKLFNRTTRRVAVTPEGAAYYERAVRLMADLEELENEMTHAKASPKGRLRVDFPIPLGHSIIIPALPDFMAKYPDIDLEMGASDRPVDLIAENIDCVVRIGTLADQSLIARRIGSIHLGICAAPSYWKKYGKPQHPSELDLNHTQVLMVNSRTGKPYPRVLRRGTEVFEVHGKKQILANDVSSCIAITKAGLGVYNATTFVSKPLLESGELESALEGWAVEPMPMWIVYPPTRHLSTKVRVFVDWIVDLFEHHPLLKKPGT